MTTEQYTGLLAGCYCILANISLLGAMISGNVQGDSENTEIVADLVFSCKETAHKLREYGIEPDRDGSNEPGDGSNEFLLEHLAGQLLNIVEMAIVPTLREHMLSSYAMLSYIDAAANMLQTLTKNEA